MGARRDTGGRFSFGRYAQKRAARSLTYRFADNNESCIELFARVVTVGVETVTITGAMTAAVR